MPRYARKYQKYSTNIYHVILRSINYQEIFYDDDDRKKFLKSLITTKEKYQYELYAYVLMDNHVHLLIRDKQNNLSCIMQSLCISYALYFNKKYNRIGHVFYNRFKSKAVETLSYLINLITYIHFNPEKEGICEYSKYNWSSYQSYFKNRKLIDSKELLQILNMDINDFRNFHAKYQIEKCYIIEELEMEKYNLDDETAIKQIKEKLQIDNLTSIANFDKEKRNTMILKAIDIKGIERKQLARILGISEKMIYRVSKRRLT